MNTAEKLQRDALVDWLDRNLAKCTDGQLLLFRRMYSHDDLSRSIAEVLQQMSERDLKNAVGQVERTAAKFGWEVS